MIITTSFFRNPYPDEKYSGTSLPTSQNRSNIQDDEVTSVHICTLSILSKAQITRQKMSIKMLHCAATTHLLTLKAPLKMSAEVICCKLLPNITSKFKYTCKKCGPRTDCSYRSSLIWVHTVCHRGLLTFQQTRKADKFCCDRRIKG